MILVLLVGQPLGDRIEVRMVAALLAFYVLFTLLLYAMHVLARDRTREESLPWPGRKQRDEDQEKREDGR